VPEATWRADVFLTSISLLRVRALSVASAGKQNAQPVREAPCERIAPSSDYCVKWRLSRGHSFLSLLRLCPRLSSVLRPALGLGRTSRPQRSGTTVAFKMVRLWICSCDCRFGARGLAADVVAALHRITLLPRCRPRCSSTHWRSTRVL